MGPLLQARWDFADLQVDSSSDGPTGIVEHNSSAPWLKCLLERAIKTKPRLNCLSIKHTEGVITLINQSFLHQLSRSDC
jgi:hypothetical protein